MSRLTDAQVRGKGTPVEVNNVEDLVIYHGKLKPVFSAPCENWFEDNDPPEKVPSGYIAIRQLNSGCLAFFPKDKLEALDDAKIKSEELHLSEDESESLDLSEDESESLDLSENKRERLRRSKKRSRWRWDAGDLVEIIYSIFRPPW